MSADGVRIEASARHYNRARPCPKCGGRKLEVVELPDCCYYHRCARCGWLGGPTIGPPVGIGSWNSAVDYERRK